MILRLPTVHIQQYLMNNDSLKISPFLRWAGSKRQILPELSRYWHEKKHKRYIEPFAGSACLFFYISPPKAIIGDINKDLIDVYKQIKTHFEYVINEIYKFDTGREAYYQIRQIDTSLLTPHQRAARFIYLNRYCFNGIYRTNLSGIFNVPYGGNKSGNIPGADKFILCSKALKNTKLIADDFDIVLQHVKKDDFVYLDPPYKVNSRRVFKEYNSKLFSTSDLLRLRSWIERIDQKGATFLVSYAACEEAEFLKHGFYSKSIQVRRNIAGFANKRKMAKELMISNIKLKRHAGDITHLKARC
jgi:DNA adenine methylase